MDAHPWTYRVSGQEVRREGLVASRPGRKRIRDPRRYAYVEACGEVRDARIAFDLGFASADGGLRWEASDARGKDFRWSEGAELEADGGPLELRVGPAGDEGG